MSGAARLSGASRGRRIAAAVAVLAVVAGIVAAGLLASGRGRFLREILPSVGGAGATSGPAGGGGAHTAARRAYVDRALSIMDDGFYAQGPGWRQARAAAQREGLAATSPQEVYAALERALAVAGRAHSRLFRPGQGLDTGVDEVLPSIRDEGCVRALVVPALGSPDPDVNRRYAQVLADAVSAAVGTACGFIVDLRANTGGNARPMVAGLAALLPDGRLLDFVHRDGSTTTVTLADNQASVGRDEMISVATGPKTDAPVAVLTDEVTASSAELVALTFTGLDRARSFGRPTAGFSSANDLFPLPDGATVMLTTGLDRDRTGTTWGGPIPPDQATLVDEDMVAAVQWFTARAK